MGSKHPQCKIGLIELNDPYNPQATPQLASNKDFCSILRKEQWNIDKGKFSRYNLQAILPFIKEAKITILNLIANNQEGLPKTLSHIGFPTLQRLKLCGNGITSIQNLIFLRAEQLIEISISWNNIGSTRPIRKFRFPKLKYLKIEENRAQNIAQDLAESHFPQLREVCLESVGKSQLVCNTLEVWAAKWESRLVYQLSCSSSSRLQRARPAQILKEKYPNLKIYRNGQRKEVTFR